jgi:ribosomal protein S7
MIKHIKSHYSHSQKISDGLYQSYWYGKFANVLIISGHKQTICHELEKVFIFFKLKNFNAPLDYYLEAIELVKPVFNVGTIVFRGKKKEFPVFLERSRQCRLVVR